MSCPGMPRRLALVLVLVTTAAAASPPDPGELAAQIRAGSPRARRAAATQLGARIADGRGAEWFAARLALSDDPQVSGPLLAGLTDAGRLLPAAARRVPTRARLRARLRKIGHGFTPEDCTVELHPDRDDAAIQCTHLVEARCLFDVIDSVTLTIGDRWSIAPVARTERPNNLCDF